MNDNTPMVRAAMMIGDFADAICAEDLNSETTTKIIVAAIPVIVSSVLFPTTELTVTNNFHAE